MPSTGKKVSILAKHDSRLPIECLYIFACYKALFVEKKIIKLFMYIFKYFFQLLTTGKNISILAKYVSKHVILAKHVSRYN